MANSCEHGSKIFMFIYVYVCIPVAKPSLLPASKEGI
jgi:hypothetical protein